MLSDNALTKLPGQLLSNLASLSHLLLDRNLLEDLPSSLFEANVSLTVLDLSHNRFNQIPEAVSKTSSSKVHIIDCNAFLEKIGSIFDGPRGREAHLFQMLLRWGLH